MAGLVPAIHVLLIEAKKDVDARHKAGHDGEIVGITRIKMKKKNAKGSVDRSETFDEFLAKDGLLAETENAALKEIIADQKKAGSERGREELAGGVGVDCSPHGAKRNAG